MDGKESPAPGILKRSHNSITRAASPGAARARGPLRVTTPSSKPVNNCDPTPAASAALTTQLTATI